MLECTDQTLKTDLLFLSLVCCGSVFNKEVSVASYRNIMHRPTAGCLTLSPLRLTSI